MSMFGKFKTLVFGDDEFEEDYEKTKKEDIDDEGTEFEPMINQRSNKVVNIHNNSSAKIVVIKPTHYEEATEIAQSVKSRKIVVVNTTILDNRIAQRLVDFVSGATSVLGAEIQEIESRVYLISPSNVEVTNELKSEITSKALFNWSK